MPSLVKEGVRTYAPGGAGGGSGLRLHRPRRARWQGNTLVRGSGLFVRVPRSSGEEAVLLAVACLWF